MTDEGSAARLSPNGGGQRSDDILARLIAQGNAGALSQLIGRYFHGMKLCALGILGDDTLAEGVTWEVFEWVWENRANWRYRKVRSFLSNKTQSLALQELRSEKARNKRHRRWATDGRSPPQTPDSIFEDNQLRAALVSAINTLPTRQREAFILREVEGLSYERVSEAMAVSPRTVEHHVKHAISKLHTRLAQSALGERFR